MSQLEVVLQEIYATLVQEAKTLESEAVSLEEAVKTKIEGFVDSFAKKLFELHAQATAKGE